MRELLMLGLWAAVLTGACREKEQAVAEADQAASVAMEQGTSPPLPADVLLVLQPLISGQLYQKADFESPSLATFDTSQQLHVLDTTDAFFVKARMRKDTSLLTGYVSKAILPDRK